ncbi:putative LRR receptor-like serine/threonine-protein kinase [Gossypium australe]|uniref:Putative LRR receptor-like serine/threonine-protein kinase n=1 Tax=Gossypium australe TaxID=47621 RepID=A0A5B6VP15_9ROSI|nr:putative LRR receptor-like serine/threonine-protein kinase [Gossypium australe]
MSLASFSPPSLPVFNGENYHIWVEVVNVNIKPPPLRANPTIAQIRQPSDDRAKKYKAMSCLQSDVSNVIFTRIMASETPKEA